MSIKFFGKVFLKWLFLLALVGSQLACDKCHELASQICECQENQEKARQCKNRLSIAKGHKFFKVANNQELCIQALKDCSCEEIAKGNDLKCGLYRQSLEEEGTKND